MSTPKLVPKQVILDPTKIGTWKVVRQPPIDRHTIIQGRERAPNSNAKKEHQFREGVRLRKALNHLTHGRDIFAYHNLRTNQVVYSLTRYLEKNNVLRQLLYHGKKTVPATLRKDHWIPYFSVHFSDSQSGLRAYHLLREFSLQRQLAPPREMITITERFLDQKRPRDREEAEEFDEEYEGKVGKLMKKKDRARAVMDQKATSVADIAAVIGIQEQEKEEAAQKTGPDGEEKLAKTKAGQKRQRIAKRRAKAYEEAVKERVENFAKALSTPEVEYKIQVPEAVQDDQVKILWTDLQDAKYAQSWPESVRHGELRKMSHGHVMPDQRPGYAENVATEDTLEEPASA